MHLALHLVHLLTQASSALPTPEECPREAQGWVPPKSRCPLCLDVLGTRGLPSATPCGHLACWTCLHEAVRASGECCVCRGRVVASRVVPLRNYSVEDVR